MGTQKAERAITGCTSLHQAPATDRSFRDLWSQSLLTKALSRCGLRLAAGNADNPGVSVSQCRSVTPELVKRHDECVSSMVFVVLFLLSCHLVPLKKKVSLPADLR